MKRKKTLEQSQMLKNYYPTISCNSLDSLNFNKTIRVAMNLVKPFVVVLYVLISMSCKDGKKISMNSNKENSVDSNNLLKNAALQYQVLKEEALEFQRIPRTLDEEGNMHWTNPKFDWTEGFFPGSCWYLYETLGDIQWRNAAEQLQAQFESHKNRTDNHDLGFVFNCSYGNGYRITNNPAYKEVLISAADSLLTRFNPSVGCIKSWDVDKGWQSKRNWQFPVIIDNMMNLELLFKVTEFTGDKKYREIAVTHANTTLKNHFRDDNSSFHVVDYDAVSGTVRSQETAQGFAHESAWARGQAWGLYGYVVCYRYTKDKKYLDQAIKISEFILKNSPEDLIPFWDYNAPKIPNEPKDVSAASITLSALLELNDYSERDYLETIERMIQSLSSNEYSAKNGESKNFILKHSVGSIPHGAEIDVPLAYADYYYIEALARYNAKYGK